MRHLVIDRQIAGIIRWLERLKKSYSSGAMESALMEAECARADLEYLRQDVWDRVRPGSLRRNKVLSTIISILRPAFLALLIILLAVAPISREVPAPVVRYDRSKIVLAEPVIIIREDNSVIDMNSPAAPPSEVSEVHAASNINNTVPVKSRRSANNIKRAQAQASGVSANTSSTAADANIKIKMKIIKKDIKPEAKASTLPLNNNNILPYDQVISLMQTGQKALKNNSSVIKIK